MLIVKRIKRLGFAFLLGIFLVLVANTIVSQAQDLRPEEVAKIVYEQIQDLPQENQYISQETNKNAADNTLIDRIVRYHLYVKDRPPNFRLDWQLTFADYLGANETISLENYPGNSTLKSNPLENDRAVISKLTRSQRNQLIDTLVSIYNPQAPSSQEPVNSPPTLPPSTPSNRNPQPQLPKPGDAKLLLVIGH
jgi:hypothetical protein